MLKKKIAQWPLWIKLGGLLIAAGLLWASNLWIRVDSIDVHFLFMLGMAACFAGLSYLILDRQTFSLMLKLWSIGTIVYFLIAIPRIYMGGTLTPYVVLTHISDRWVYSLLLPLVLLGTFSAGLIFMQVTSPIEFLDWGNIGLKIALLFRVLQHAMQSLQDVKIVLMMQDRWPEESGRWICLRDTYKRIKGSILLVHIVFRHIILYWFPWGWLCFHRLQQRIGAED
ncbi:MAG TPA: hypothetical protein DIC51_02490 [Coxiellaceae bacterium]|nr:hypothetical protein [Coxiellaceae bacterium]